MAESKQPQAGKQVTKAGTSRERSFASSVSPEIIKSLFTDDETVKRPAVVTVSKPVNEVYAFFRNFENLSKFISGVQSVRATHSQKVYHWVAVDDASRLAAPKSEWDSEIIAENVNQMIAWQTVGEGAFDQVGAVTFEPATGGKGTVVTLKMVYTKTIGQVAGQFSKLLGKDPYSQSYINLRRLKAFMETGEVPTVEGQPNGKDEDSLKH